MNTRFVVTSRYDEPKQLYDWYVRRGECENSIKDYKRYCKADRLSCHRFIANQLRLLLHAAAYWLLDSLRRRLVRAGKARMQLNTLRLWLHETIDFLKGGRVHELVRCVQLHLAFSHPGQPLWDALTGFP